MTIIDGAVHGPVDPALQEAESVSFRDFRPGAFALRDVLAPLAEPPTSYWQTRARLPWT